MAQCKWCGRSGWLLSLTNIGVCSSCNNLIASEFMQRGRIIRESIQLVDNSKNLDTKLSRCDLIVDMATALQKYEKHGIAAMRPSPSELAATYRGMRDALIVNGLRSELEVGQSKARLAVTTRAKIAPLAKVLLRVQDYVSELADSRALDEIMSQTKAMIHEIQLRGFLDAAARHEFKGMKKKALDQYYEALYFLRHDDVDDAFQVNHISAIEAKISELGGDTVA